MKPQKDIVIVSAFGRGQWLASELSRQYNLNVSLVDVSDQLGRWGAEDWEGPFGLLRSEELTQTQMGRLSHEDYSDLNSQGMTLWLKNGPIDFMGPITQFWLDSSDGPMPYLKKYLSQWDSQKNKAARKSLSKAALLESFEKSWMVHLAHQMASPVFLDNAHGSLYGSPMPFFAPWYTRRSTRKGYSKSLEWCASTGVDVLSKAKVQDIEVENKKWLSLEVNAQERSGALRGDQLIWMLTSLETHYILKDRLEDLFPKGPIEPQWAWVRFRFNIQLEAYEETVPSHFVIVKDNHLPWTHDNLLIAIQVVTGGAFDVWSRWPYHQRFQRSSLDTYSQEIEAVLKDRFPNISIELSSRPQEYEYEYDQLGPCVFPVYSEESVKNLQQKKYSNLYYSGPENWERMDWTGRFQHDSALIPQILEYQKQLVKKEKRSDSTIHPT